jgi:hypothetical protein
MPKTFKKYILTSDKIAVILHLYYTEQLPYFLEKLKSLEGQDYDLFITLVKDDAQIKNQIKAFNPTARIFVVENSGYDVWPFIFVINQINLADYSYIIKVHSKNITPGHENPVLNGICVKRGHWQNCLVNALIKNQPTLVANIKRFKRDKKLGMLGSRIALVSHKDYYVELLGNIDFILSKLGIKQRQKIKFVAGTMFMARSDIFKILQNKFTAQDFVPTDKNIKCGTLAHGMERVFGIITREQGFKVCGVGNFVFFLRKAAKYLFREHTSLRGNYRIKILGMPIYGKSLLTKEEKLLLKSKLFDTRFYYDRYIANDRTAGFPVRHYLNEGWKLGNNPGKQFDGNAYLQNYEDVKNANVNPLLHYILHGKRENRNIVNNMVLRIGDFICEGKYFALVVTNSGVALDFKIAINGALIKPCQDYSWLKGKNHIDILMDFLKRQRNQNYCIFKIPREQIKNNTKIEFLTQTGVKIKIMASRGYSISFQDIGNNLMCRIINDTLLIETKKTQFFRILVSKNYSLKDKILILRIICRSSNKFIFCEKETTMSDNSWELFRYSVARGKAAYFITNNKNPTNTDKNLHKRILQKNSKRHLKVLLSCNTIVFNTNYCFALHKDLKDIHYNFISTKWVYAPHGITAGHNDCVENSPYNFLSTKNSIILAGAKPEKEKFLFMGYEKVYLTGHPRFDKWSAGKVNDDEIVIFFTHRYNLNNNHDAFINSIYYKEIIKLLNFLLKHLPNKKINYCFHDAMMTKNNTALKQGFLAGQSIKFIDIPSGPQEFNAAFKQARYMITDISSVSFDFAYAQGKISIAYLPDGFLENHLLIDNAKFTDMFLGVITKEPQEVLSTLSGDIIAENLNQKRESFFAYLDENNCKRCFDILIGVKDYV